jgi:hypothetical protein
MTMAEQDPFDRSLTRAELANKLKHTISWTHRHLPALIRDQEFPPAFLPNTWSERAVDRWIAWRSSASTLRFPDWCRLQDRAASEQTVTGAATLQLHGADLAARARELAQGRG